MLRDDHRSTGDRPITSWKEIASFFGRSVRTVQEWEKQGLPVHRHRHKSKDSVYAYARELDAWWTQRGVEAPHADGSPQSIVPNGAPPTRRRTWLAVSLLILVATVLQWPREPGSSGADVLFPASVIEGPAPGSSLYGGVIGDVNGDDRDDVVLSAHNDGIVGIFFGGALPPANASLAAAPVTIDVTGASSLLARQIGDFNGDAIDDVLLSSGLSEPESFVRSAPSFIVWGRRDWPSSLTLPEDAGVILRIDRRPETSMSGCNLHRESDLNGDRLADVWLGAFDYGDGSSRSAGAVFVLFGRREWPKALEVGAAADITFHGSRMGEGLAGGCVIGRVDSESAPLVALYATERQLWNLLGGAGRAYVFSPNHAWPAIVDAAGVAQWRVEGTRGDAVLWNLTLGDLDGDGQEDLAAGVGRSDDPAYPGEVRIWFGGRERRGVFRADAADVIIRGDGPGAHLGEKVKAADIDGDGIDDLIAAQPGRGELFLITGRRSWIRAGLLDAFDAITLLHSTPGQAWWEIAVGDLDADLLPELVVASPYVDTAAGKQSGRAWIIKPYRTVRVDVRPDHDPNPVVLPDGLCVVRIYGWTTDRRESIDPATVRVAGASPTRHVTSDYDGDGAEDMTVYFQTAAMTIAPGTTRIALHGRTFSGTPIAGTDSVVLVTAAH